MKSAALLFSSFLLLLSPLYAQSLTIPLTFTNGSASQVITVGFEPGASDAYDLGIDKLAPPSPPGPLFDVRAIFDGIEYYQDLRDTTDVETLFHISLDQTQGSSSFLLEWDSAALDGLGTFEITDDMDGTLFGPVDMTTTSSLDILAATALLDNGLRIRVVIDDGMGNVSIDEERELANQFSLDQNFPNPFRETTDIAFSVSQAEHVKLVVYDLLGKEKGILVDAFMSPGAYTFTWDATEEASGMYYYSLTVGSQVATRPMILTK